MQNISSNWGWSIDSLWNTSINKHLQFVRWTSGTSNIAADFDDQGRLGLQCIPNVPPYAPAGASGLALDVNGSARIKTSLFVIGRSSIADLSANTIQGQNLSISGDTLVTDLSANTIQGQTLLVSGDTCVDDLSANTIQGQTLLVSGDTRVDDLSANTIQGQTLLVSGNTRMTDLSANTIQGLNLFITGDTLVDDLSANTINAATAISSTGPIASSLAITSRGSTNTPVNLTTGGNTLQNWTKTLSTSSAYSTFLVNVNAVFDASSITSGQLMTAILDISVNGVAKYFLAGTSDTSGVPFTHKLYPVSFSFITSPIANNISVQGKVSNGVFVDTNGTNSLTTIDIIGIA